MTSPGMPSRHPSPGGRGPLARRTVCSAAFVSGRPGVGSPAPGTADPEGGRAAPAALPRSGPEDVPPPGGRTAVGLDAEAARRFPNDSDARLLFGLVTFDGPERVASTVLVPFCSALEADRYATTHGLDDYVVAPLAFLTAR